MVVAFVTHEELAPVLQKQRELELLLEAYVESVDDDVTTTQALRILGIKSRTTLDMLCDSGHIAWRKEGRKCLYSRKSCITYKLSKRLGKSALRLAS